VRQGRSAPLNCHSVLVLALYQFARGTVDQVASRPYTGQLARTYEQALFENYVGTLFVHVGIFGIEECDR
jgi:hypothetical protein